MKHTPIRLLTLLAASATAASGTGSGLNYNRVEVGYLSNDALKGFSVSATAELAHSGVIVSGIYADVDGKGSISGYSGHETGFNLGYKFNVGAGDLAVGLGYLQGQFGSSYGVAQAKQTSLGIQYRQALGSSAEFSVGYQRIRTNLGALEVDTLGHIYIGAAAESDNVFNLGLRYNFTQNIDVSLIYAFASKNSSGNTLGLSAGYSF